MIFKEKFLNEKWCLMILEMLLITFSDKKLLAQIVQGCLTLSQRYVIILCKFSLEDLKHMKNIFTMVNSSNDIINDYQ